MGQEKGIDVRLSTSFLLEKPCMNERLCKVCTARQVYGSCLIIIWGLVFVDVY
ncbi:hypothetical protein BD408DRAFT_409147 [Parasitella parasitica]|nr:hypothetical protein BD408DRAFT_409147 [Parasitella parasitica]